MALFWQGVKNNFSGCSLGTLNPFRYRGYYYDTETGLYYLQTRYYDPEIGRFITIDDVAYLDPDTVGGLNLYAYCGNNPVMCVDPSGTSNELLLPNTGNFTKAKLVSNRILGGGGLPIVGHTQLYLFHEETNTWYLTEYTGPFEAIIDGNKATVRWDPISGEPELDNVDGIDYVEIEGNFNISAQHANSLKGDSLGGYNLFLNNCCDYTDTLLAEATGVEGYFTRKHIEKVTADSDAISIPIVHVKMLQLTTTVDAAIKAVKETAERIWDAITFWD